MHKTREWIRDMGMELEDDDRHHAYVALRAALHTLRDRLTIEQSAHFAAQLPLVLRGLYFEGWSPAHVPQRIRNQDEYLESVQLALADAPPDLQDRFLDVTRGAFRVIATHIDEGEVMKVVESLPKPLRALWPAYA
jgi:uncharacterized protein (DUF2267 family)